ncbi:cell wall hydrolase [Erythrobacteraceae bacterium WH01K]|nr:cell wall hydrolase [Erythrobacteraceae bacterium WH01K]
MSRKTHKISLAAIAAGFVLIAASAEGSGANAEVGEIEQVQAPAPVVDETVPVFVTEEVVQPLPEESTEDSPAAEPAEEPAPSASSLREMIASIDAPANLSRELECLAGAVYFESRGEPIDGQLAVAQVVINRADSHQFPSDYCGVVYQRAQFSFVKNGRMPRISRGSSAWQKAKKIATIAHRGLWDSEAEDSLYFHAKYVSPRWARVKSRRVAINTHIFYR